MSTGGINTHKQKWFIHACIFCPFQGSGCVVVDALFSVTAIVCGGFVFGSCFVVHILLPFLVLQLSRWGRES